MPSSFRSFFLLRTSRRHRLLFSSVSAMETLPLISLIGKVSPFRYISCISSYILAVLVAQDNLPDTGTLSSRKYLLTLMPPTGSTLPRSVISPVMARLAFTFFWVRAEAREVAIVIPGRRTVFRNGAFGHMDMDVPVIKNLFVKIQQGGMRLDVFNASMADSFITSPKLPVNVQTSTLATAQAGFHESISPPTAVHARPVTTPACSLP